MPYDVCVLSDIFGMFVTKYLSKITEEVNRKNCLPIEKYDELLPQFEESPVIAKHIFQICLLGDGSSSERVMHRLTPEFIDNIDKLKRNNPEYNYHLFSDQEARQFILQYYGPFVWNYYRRIDSAYLAAKADLLRYLVLYALGGVYLDLKSTVDSPFSEVLREDDRFMVFYWDNMPNGQHHYLIPEYIQKGEMLQGFIISASGHVFLRKVILSVLQKIDRYNPYKDGIGWEGTLKTVGPVIYTQTVFNLIQDTDDLYYREAGPFNEFGYRLSFLGTYSPGQYQKSLLMKDYRKSSRPVIMNGNRWVQAVNALYLKILKCFRSISMTKQILV